eukprot:Gb_01206 [translate_table: standard]
MWQGLIGPDSFLSIITALPVSTSSPTNILAIPDITIVIAVFTGQAAKLCNNLLMVDF